MPSWRLDDADPIAAEHPYTFYKPSRQLIERVAVGEVVKLIFRFESDDPKAPGAERMWVVVEQIRDDGSFRGRLDNEPVHITDLKFGEPVEFDARHIINTEHDDPDNLVNRYIKRCFVTKRVLRDGAKVGYLYREKPDRADDSGWRLTANDESDQYMENVDNISYVSLGAVLAMDDSFVSLLQHPAGSAFALDEKTNRYVPCADT